MGGCRDKINWDGGADYMGNEGEVVIKKVDTRGHKGGD